MIIDKIANIGNYKGLTNNLDTAIDYTVAGISKDIENGVHEIIGKEIFAVAAEYETKDYEDSKNEAHKKYIDIQIILNGSEIIYASNIAKLKVLEAYDNERDVMFLEKSDETIINLEEGMFCIFFPWDAHMPGVTGKNGKSKIKKVVLKVNV